MRLGLSLMALCITRYTFCSAERGFLPHSSCNGQFRSVHTLRSGMPENLYVRAILAAIVILTALIGLFAVRMRGRGRILFHVSNSTTPFDTAWPKTNTASTFNLKHYFGDFHSPYFTMHAHNIQNNYYFNQVNAKSWLKRDFVDIFHKRKIFALFFAFNIFCASP